MLLCLAYLQATLQFDANTQNMVDLYKWKWIRVLRD